MEKFSAMLPQAYSQFFELLQLSKTHHCLMESTMSSTRNVLSSAYCVLKFTYATNTFLQKLFLE